MVGCTVSAKILPNNAESEASGLTTTPLLNLTGIQNDELDSES